MNSKCKVFKTHFITALDQQIGNYKFQDLSGPKLQISKKENGFAIDKLHQFFGERLIFIA
jgi:hypothetical protein